MSNQSNKEIVTQILNFCDRGDTSERCRNTNRGQCKNNKKKDCVFIPGIKGKITGSGQCCLNSVCSIANNLFQDLAKITENTDISNICPSQAGCTTPECCRRYNTCQRLSKTCQWEPNIEIDIGFGSCQPRY